MSCARIKRLCPYNCRIDALLRITWLKIRKSEVRKMKKIKEAIKKQLLKAVKVKPDIQRDISFLLKRL